MSYDSEIFTKAEREITARRLKAESISNRHMEEIEMKIPEISEINHFSPYCLCFKQNNN